MKIDFALDGKSATFERSGLTGRAVLRIGEEAVTLQSPWNPLTHFGLSRTNAWTKQLGGYEIVVLKERERMFGGLRDAHFIVRVDGEEVASSTGF